ncbi:hypothetical protein CNR22_22250 [Sphingobacteriaceae bacterium]|nr:hypothetical protein CNR22_22250 [Sphingobacteriaceae bacterium]
MNFNFKLLFAALGLSLSVSSQNTSSESLMIKRGCGTTAPDAAWDAWFNAKVKEYKENKSANKTTQNVSITIPVIVHIIHNGAAKGTFPNVTAAQVYSQFNVLNKDFGGMGYNSYQLANTSFSTVGVANTNITFCPAQIDPDGNVLDEPGIHRVNYNTITSSNPTSFSSLNNFKTYMDGTIKANTIWDPASYFNIWISDVNVNAGILGYATFPGGSSLNGISSNIGNGSDDGIWVWTRSFGTSGSVQAPYNLGRTATHETGHYFGLRHIGGDGNGNPAGDCDATDYCEDTPPQKGGENGGSYGQNFGGPSYPLHPNVCASTEGDMFMNFMDYTDDAYNYMFTPDQNDRIQTALANSYFRNLLSASSATQCTGMPLADIFGDASVCSDGWIPTNGTDGSPTPTYSWVVKPSVGVTFSPSSTNATPRIQFPASGDYTITVIATNSLGSTTATFATRAEDCTGIKTNKASSLNVSLVPNPTSGVFTVSSLRNFSEGLQITVYNALGQTVLTKAYTSSDSPTINIDLSAYQNGVYSVVLGNSTEKTVKRLVLTK